MSDWFYHCVQALSNLVDLPPPAACYPQASRPTGLALIGEIELALDSPELDVNLGTSNYPLLSELDPFPDNVRGEERFKTLMERVKSEWERF